MSAAPLPRHANLNVAQCNSSEVCFKFDFTLSWQNGQLLDFHWLDYDSSGKRQTQSQREPEGEDLPDLCQSPLPVIHWALEPVKRSESAEACARPASDTHLRTAGSRTAPAACEMHSCPELLLASQKNFVSPKIT